MFDLNDKRILITGSSHGLGAVCAREFSKLGAGLVLTSRSKKELEAVRKSCLEPEKHFVIAADLTKTAELQKMVSQAKKSLGQIDAVLHVAGGGLGLRDSLISASDFQKLFSLNVVAAAEINRLVAPDMIKRKKGNLVHVVSIAASEATGSVGYNTVKAALAAYVRTLGRELAASGVIATGILPGGFFAPGNSWDRLKAIKPAVVAKFIKERLPRGYLIQPEELIPILAYLCSEQASAMSGCLVPIDGGEGKAYAV